MTRRVLQSPPSRPVAGGHESKRKLPQLELNCRAPISVRLGLAQVNDAEGCSKRSRDNGQHDPCLTPEPTAIARALLVNPTWTDRLPQDHTRAADAEILLCRPVNFRSPASLCQPNTQEPDRFLKCLGAVAISWPVDTALVSVMRRPRPRSRSFRKETRGPEYGHDLGEART